MNKIAKNAFNIAVIGTSLLAGGLLVDASIQPDRIELQTGVGLVLSILPLLAGYHIVKARNILFPK